MTISKVTWLHISDFHFKSNNYDQDVVLSALIASIKHYQDIGQKADLIFATGDIASTGKAEEYAAATRFFDDLLTITGLTKEQLIIVPGNHDVDRTQGTALIRTLNSGEEADNYFILENKKYHILDRLGAFREWYDSYFPGNPFCTTSSCGQIRNINIQGFSIAILPINTAIFCHGDDDHGKLWIGRRALTDILKTMKTDADLKIALMHHPIDWLNEKERINIDNILRENFDCILSGHLHTTATDRVKSSNNEAIYLAVGAVNQSRKRSNTAMYVSVLNDEISIFPIRYEDTPTEIWTLDPSLFPRSPDYKGSIAITHLKSSSLSNQIEAQDKVQDIKVPAPILPLDELKKTLPSTLPVYSDFEQEMLRTSDGKVLYVEPRIMDIPQEFQGYEEPNAIITTIEEIVLSEESYIIETRSEYGGTTLCRRLASEIAKRVCKAVHFADACHLPNYRKKLGIEFKNLPHPEALEHILILDNFDAERDEKLLREIRSFNIFNRFIFVVSNNGLRHSSVIHAGQEQLHFKYRYLWSLNRGNIRTIAEMIFDSGDTNLISTAVDKVYSDLLGLCIPLTPFNVVMYLRVIHKEGNCHPLNRVDIVERYLTDMLSKPSDFYNDTFSARNKMDILSVFIFKLYGKEKNSFSSQDWYSFCQNYMGETLIQFNMEGLLNDLQQTRIVILSDGKFTLKYSFFFSFFLGRHIARRPNLLIEFLDKPENYLVGGMVEVIAGLSHDNTLIITKLVERLEKYLVSFNTDYMEESFDPYKDARWPDNHNEKEKLWDPINRQIEDGPKSTSELDQIKTSLYSELQTSDQRTRFVKFEKLESALFQTASFLLEALKSSDDIPGELKKRSVLALLKTQHIALQVGAIFAPLIAKNRYVQWGGISFINYAFEPQTNKEQSIKALHFVLKALSRSVALKTGQNIATRKLGEVFKSISLDSETNGFISLLIFNCILVSKPKYWHDVLQSMIEKSDKNSYYLSVKLDLLMTNFKEDINLGKDQASLKTLIAMIRAKRDCNKNIPGAKLVTRVLRHLEGKNLFENKTSSDTTFKPLEDAN